MSHILGGCGAGVNNAWKITNVCIFMGLHLKPHPIALPEKCERIDLLLKVTKKFLS